jgi:hypothetical protein
VSIVSIGEVVGSVQGEPSAQEQQRAEQARQEEQGARPLSSQMDELERELRAKARRRARLQAD